MEKGQTNGYPVFTTNQIPSTLGTSPATKSGMFYGNWESLVIALWGTLDLLVDPYTFSTSGGVRIVALQSADIGLRHNESFSYAADITV